MKYNFTQDWFSQHIPNWKVWLKEFEDKHSLNFLEIGCFEGRASVWLLENYLKNAGSSLTVIDTFKGSEESEWMKLNTNDVRIRFWHNILATGLSNKVHLMDERSDKALSNLNNFLFTKFDLIYIDGSHMASDVLLDSVLSFRLLKKNGIMIFDDYEWLEQAEKDKLDWVPHHEPHQKPKIAIDSFLACFKGQYELIHKGYQVCIKKI